MTSSRPCKEMTRRHLSHFLILQGVPIRLHRTNEASNQLPIKPIRWGTSITPRSLPFRQSVTPPFLGLCRTCRGRRPCKNNAGDFSAGGRWPAVRSLQYGRPAGGGGPFERRRRSQPPAGSAGRPRRRPVPVMTHSWLIRWC